MRELNVGVRELKTQLSAYLREVKRGQTVLITEHGRVIGRLLPAAASLEERIEALQRAGLAPWNGKQLKQVKPVARVRGKRTAADLLLEDRR
ncbi:MAG: type II toxin-antitoxin system prevent-host-death family antitoxin [Anaerolineales bacterium]|nr:type II toxin-antitoxin system prevent-host-death family antitoxin [Anaerolineales bacterium]